MSEIGRADSMVRGIAVFLGWAIGAATLELAHRSVDITVPGAIGVLVLAFVASNYVHRDTEGGTE